MELGDGVGDGETGAAELVDGPVGSDDTGVLFGGSVGAQADSTVHSANTTPVRTIADLIKWASSPLHTL